jgi:hypothetical protein
MNHPSQAEVLEAIAGLFSGKPRAAALAHYPSLRIQTANLHHALVEAIGSTREVIEAWEARLKTDEEVVAEFSAISEPLHPYRVLAPALARSVHQTAKYLLDETQAAPAVATAQAGEIDPSFSSFVKLGSAVRSFLDAVVQAAYQLVSFESRQLNYKFLQSLASFAAVAPESLHSNIVSPEIQSALDAYLALPPKERKNSPFTKASHEQFPQRLLVASQSAGLPDWRRSNLELLFSFCSDFVHSGYVSALATGEGGPQIILGGPGDTFTPRAENFAELKRRLLAEAAGAYADLFLPTLRQGIERMLVSGVSADWVTKLEDAARDIDQLRAIVDRRLVEPVRRGVVGSAGILDIECACKGVLRLEPPHHEWDSFCPECGSRFILQEIDEDVDYVISPFGVGRVLFNDAIPITDLGKNLGDKLGRIKAKHTPPHREDGLTFVPIADLMHCDEDTLKVGACVTSTPSDELRAQCSMFAFVPSKSLERCAVIRIRCNCGNTVDYDKALQTNVCQCGKCKAHIGLMGVTGNGTAIQIRHPDGTPGTAPIQARNRFRETGIAQD